MRQHTLRGDRGVPQGVASVLASCTLLVLTTGVWGRPGDTPSSPREGGPAPTLRYEVYKDGAWVEADSAERARMESIFNGYKAVTRPSQDAILGFSLATTVKEIAARGGQAVKEGQLLLRGDDAEDKALLAIQKLRAQTPLNVDAAKARLDLAKVEHERIKTAQSQGAASQPEVERARLQAEISRLDWELAKDAQQQEVLQLERMQARADRYSLKAPFDGTVDLVNADLGQVVSENEKIVRVVDTDPLWIDVPAETGRSETLLLKVGAPAWVTSDSGGLVAVREGKVIEVAPTVDPASRTRRIRVELPNPSGSSALLAGEPVTVRFTPPEGTHGRPQETESK